MMFEIDPELTPRTQSYNDFINAPMPMVTLFKTIDVTRLVKKSRQGYKYNMLMCYCIGQAAKQIPEMLFQIREKTMLKYGKFAIDVIVGTKSGALGYCDVPVVDDIEEFNRLYLERTAAVRDSGENMDITDSSIICTSALVKYDIDGVVNLYHTIYDHPFLAWGKSTRQWFRTKQKLSFQWHHVIMDGVHACRFLEEIERAIGRL